MRGRARMTVTACLNPPVAPYCPFSPAALAHPCPFPRFPVRTTSSFPEAPHTAISVHPTPSRGSVCEPQHWRQDMWVLHEAERISRAYPEGPAEDLGFAEGRDRGEVQRLPGPSGHWVSALGSLGKDLGRGGTLRNSGLSCCVILGRWLPSLSLFMHPSPAGPSRSSPAPQFHVVGSFANVCSGPEEPKHWKEVIKHVLSRMRALGPPPIPGSGRGQMDGQASGGSVAAGHRKKVRKIISS